jgi:hypothetical protein
MFAKMKNIYIYMQISFMFLSRTFACRKEVFLSQELSPRSFNGVFNYGQNMTPCLLPRITVSSIT